MQVYVGSGSDSGRVRKSNQDSIGVDLQNGLFIVADGVGGHAGGDVASSTLVSLVREYVVSVKPVYEDRKNALVAAIREANARILQMALSENKRGMSTTVTAFLIGFGRYFVAQVGDSRAYLIRGNQIAQITRDHSFVQQLVDRGVITLEEARHHDRRNEITRSVGLDTDVEIDTYEGEFRETDALLACSDGLWEEVTDREILDTVLGSEDGQRACDALVELANRNGGHDNISVILAQSTPTMSRVMPRRAGIRLGRLIPRMSVRKNVLVGAGGVVVLALAVLLLLRLVPLHPSLSTRARFETTPETLDVTSAKAGIGKALKVTTGETRLLRFHDTLVFRSAGYIETTLVVDNPARREYKIELRRKLVSVTFNLPPGAEVRFSDGRKAGSKEALPLGSHPLWCTRPGYQSYEDTLQITDTTPVVFEPAFDSKREELPPVPPPKPMPKPPVSSSETVIVRFRSRPGQQVNGAEILIDGKPTGNRVPYNLILERGPRYTIELQTRDGTRSQPRELRTSQKTDFTYTESDFQFR